MDLKLRGKRALVTGSTAGIGFAIARGLARERAEVIINGRSEEKVAEAVRRITSEMGSSATGIAADLSSAEGVNRLLERAGRVDILINNIGIFEPVPFLEISDQDWFRFFELNVMSGVRLARALIPSMLRRNWGRIIFISSESGAQIPSEMIHYGVTKTMQIALARGLAETTAGTGVTVNSVLPGPTRSEGVEDFVRSMAESRGVTEAQVESEFFANVRPTSLLRRFATTDEVAALVAFVASPLSSATNGAALRVDGGVVRSIL